MLFAARAGSFAGVGRVGGPLRVISRFEIGRLVFFERSDLGRYSFVTSRVKDGVPPSLVGLLLFHGLKLL